MAEEPWLRGPIGGVDPLIAPLLHSFQMAQEDLARWTEGLSIGQIWARHGDVNPVGRELRHIAGSVDRLVMYLEGRHISAEQLESAKHEDDPGASRNELLAGIDAAFQRAERVARALDRCKLSEPRAVGRKQLPTTVIGLIVHIAEHTQRHVGSAIVAAKLSREISAR